MNGVPYCSRMKQTAWAKRISQLQLSGLTYAQIAELIGVAPSTIGDLAVSRSSEPKGDTALKLDALHRERCGERA